MLSKPKPTSQLGFWSTFEEQLSHQHPLYIFANQINWKIFETAFSQLDSDEGRPSKPIRLMVSLIILKHIRNISDESVVEQWFENIYYQYFSGEKSCACGAPCEASELAHFRSGNTLTARNSNHVCRVVIAVLLKISLLGYLQSG